MGIAVSTNPALYHDGYSTVDEMPVKMRRVYDRIVAKLSANGYTVRADGAQVVIPKLNARITLNGGEFNSPEAMPPRQLRIFQDALAAALPLEHAICAIVEARRFYQRAAFHTLLVALSVEIAAAAFLWTRGYFS